MSTATGRGRLFFQAEGDPTGPSELAPKTQSLQIESILTKYPGLVSSQFLDILYPWIGSIKGHYRLVRPGRRGSCGTLVIYERNQQANVQFGLKTKCRTSVIANFAYIVPLNEHCNRPWPLIFLHRRGPHRSLWGSPKNAKSSYWIEPHKISRTCVIAVFGYIIPLDRVYQRPLSPGSARPYGVLLNPRHLLEKSTGECTIWSQNKCRTCVIAVLTYIRGIGHINSLVSPLGAGRP